MSLEQLGVGALFAILGAVFLAAQAVLIRIGTDEGDVLHALAIALAVNVILLGGGTVVWYYPQYHLTVLSVLVFVGAGLSSTVLGRSLYFLSISRIGASRTEPIKASQPLHATIVAVLILGEAVTSLQVVGIILIVLGVGAISWESNRRREGQINATWGDLTLPVSAAFLFGIEPTFVKLGFAEGTPVFVGLAVKTLAAAGGFLLYLRWKDEIPGSEDVRGIKGIWYVAAGVANTGFLTMYFFALESAKVGVVVPLIQSSPLLVILISYVFLDRLERVTALLAVGAIITVAGATIVTLFS